MTMHKLVITETKPVGEIEWWHQTKEGKDEHLTHVERGKIYNLNFENWPDVNLLDDKTLSLYTSSTETHGSVYKMEIVYSSECPIVFFNENTPEYEKRMQYCRDENIVVETSVVDIPEE